MDSKAAIVAFEALARSAAESGGGAWRGLRVQSSRGAVPKMQVQVACYVTRREEGAGDDFDEVRDTEPQTWQLFSRVDRVEHCRSGVPILIASHVRLEVVSKFAGNEDCTPLLQKDAASEGADFKGRRLVNVGHARRSNATYRVEVWERLKTDFNRVRRLGYVEVPLSDVPILNMHGTPASLVRREPPMKRYDVIRRSLDGTSETKNGSIFCSIWMAPVLASDERAVFVFLEATFLAVYLFALWFTRRWYRVSWVVAVLLTGWLPFLRLILELPQILGVFLTKVLKVAEPGLGLSFGAVRLFAWVSDIERRATSPQDRACVAARATRRMTLRVEVDDFAISNPGDDEANYAHEDFVSAKRVKLTISCDKRLLLGGWARLCSYVEWQSHFWRGELSAEDVGMGAPALVAWSPFPARQVENRAKTHYLPTRLGSVRVEVKVEDASVAFNIGSAGEFNINHFVRALAEAKVASILRKGEPAPNCLEVTVIRATCLPLKSSPKVVVTLRENSQTTATRRSDDGTATWNQTFRFHCPDPSAVVHLAVHDAGLKLNVARASLIGQWLTTSKMLALAPSNIWADGQRPLPSPDYGVRAQLILRDAAFLPVEATRLEVQLRYYYDEAIPSTLEALKSKPVTALAQLQMNSLELTRRLGSLRSVQMMLDDFPILFDVRQFEISHINFYLKDLFAGAYGQSADDGGAGRSASGRKDNIFVEKLDLRDHLQGGERCPDGISLWTLARLVVVHAVRPVLSEVDVFGAVGHILAGVFEGARRTARRSDIDAAATILASTSSAVHKIDRKAAALKDLVQGAFESSAAKYLTSHDSEALMRPAHFHGLLLKATKRTSTFRTNTSYSKLNHVELRVSEGRFVLFYTKKDAQSGYKGATKKFVPSSAKFDGSRIKLIQAAPGSAAVLRAGDGPNGSGDSPNGSGDGSNGPTTPPPRAHKHKKELILRAPIRSDEGNPTVEEWWLLIAGPDAPQKSRLWLPCAPPPEDDVPPPPQTTPLPFWHARPRTLFETPPTTRTRTSTPPTKQAKTPPPKQRIPPPPRSASPSPKSASKTPPPPRSSAKAPPPAASTAQRPPRRRATSA
ncbi:hypothetical protein M885DRAFT_505209 [Pelagophyceae sp. CCMP2097]|nr:hypothetical protein M885DRAFT_505209 [Pelagophyceae sp. CCMP2097]